jgi:hypothetical protein
MMNTAGMMAQPMKNGMRQPQALLEMLETAARREFRF